MRNVVQVTQRRNGEEAPFPQKQEILEMLRYIHSLAFLCFVLSVVQSKCVSLAGACRNTRD